MPRARSRGIGRAVRVVVLITVGLLLWRGADVLWGQNFGCIVEGEAYRSAQLNTDELERASRELGLKAVVNLRGVNDAEWYRKEIECCRRLGIEHYDLALSARHLPKPEDLARLVEIFESAPTPLLIHCKNGADRTGLASALYLALRAGVDEQDAHGEGLAFWRGHVDAGATASLDELFRLRRDNEPNLELSRWIREVYPRLYTHTRLAEGEAHG